MDAIAADFKPAFEQIKLCAFARTVDSLNDYQSAWILALRGDRS
jgi:hypothetical protein